MSIGKMLHWSDVAIDATSEAVKLRREMESQFAGNQRVA